MLEYANIEYEYDEETYPGRNVVRVFKYNMLLGKKVVIAIFDFSKSGGLLNIS